MYFLDIGGGVRHGDEDRRAGGGVEHVCSRSERLRESCGSLYKHIHSAKVALEMALKADGEQKRGNTFFYFNMWGGFFYFNMWGGVLFLYILADEPCESADGSGCADDNNEGCGQTEKGK